MPAHFKPVVIFALATGLRRSNITDLEWSQIDMQRKVAWIHPEDAKAGRAIGVALNDSACKVLRDQAGKHNRWVFVHTESSVRPDGTRTKEVMTMRGDADTALRAALRIARMRISVFMTYDTPGRAGLFSPECRYQRYMKWGDGRVLRWCRDMRTWHLIT